jgi:hypothetical protein
VVREGKVKGKILGFLIFCGIAGAMFLFDLGRSALFTISLVEVNPSPIPADGTSPVLIKVRLTKNERPVEGHDLYIVSLDGGNFSAYRIRTDVTGEVTYTYYPYRVSAAYPLRDIRFVVRDESNSVFIEVDARLSFTVPAVEAETYRESSFSARDIFGE